MRNKIEVGDIVKLVCHECKLSFKSRFGEEPHELEVIRLSFGLPRELNGNFKIAYPSCCKKIRDRDDSFVSTWMNQ